MGDLEASLTAEGRGPGQGSGGTEMPLVVGVAIGKFKGFVQKKAF